MFLAGEPPKATHHDKEICVRDGFSTLKNSKALEAANAWFSQRMASNTGKTILGGPLQIALTFVWHDAGLHSDHNRFTTRVWMVQKPDWDNAAKGAVDCLARCGWIEDDKQISQGMVRKVLSSDPAEEGLYIQVSPAPPVPTLPNIPKSRPAIEAY